MTNPYTLCDQPRRLYDMHSTEPSKEQPMSIRSLESCAKVENTGLSAHVAVCKCCDPPGKMLLSHDNADRRTETIVSGELAGVS